MKQFLDATNLPTTTSAAILMELGPLLMRTMRSELRARHADLSMAQFRALAFLNRHPGASLSGVAARVNLTLSAASRLVDALVARGLVTRAAAEDRRYVTLDLTAEGETLLKAAREATRARLNEMLARLSGEELAVVERALELLRGLFEAGTAPQSER